MLNEDALFGGEKPSAHPVLFEDIDESMVKEAVLKTKGGYGPSGLDAYGSRKIIVSKIYEIINADLRRMFANVIKRYAVESSLLTQPKMKHHSKHF